MVWMSFKVYYQVNNPQNACSSCIHQVLQIDEVKQSYDHKKTVQIYS